MLIVGWYLMGPALNKSHELSNWVTYQSFDSARSCETVRNIMHKVAKDELKLKYNINTDNLDDMTGFDKAIEKAKREGISKKKLTEGLTADLRGFWSQCIASDDPRLKR